MTPLPTIDGGFRLIVADPPTDFRAGKKGRPQHYGRMSDREIAALPVGEVAAPDCWLMLWVTSPKLYRPPGSKALSVEEIIIAPRREHSRKPDEFYARALALVGDVPRLELFARESRFGFVPWGDQAGLFDGHGSEG